MNGKRIVSALLCVLMICTIVASCGKNNSDSVSTQTGETTAETAAETTVFDGLPDKTFDGREFKFVFRTDQEYQFYTDTLDGEVINDSVYARNSEVENKYDIAITPIPVVGDWANSNTFITTVRSSVMAGDAAFDLIDGYAAYIGTMFSDHLFLNLNDVNYLRLTEPWWSQFAVDELTVNGKLFAIPGDLSLNLWQNMQVMYFNKTVLADYSRKEPYELVTSGTWTYDAYLELIKGIYSDVDGDSKATAADKYGSVFYDDLTFDNFHNAFNIMYTVKNEDGTRDLQLNTDEIVKMYETINDLAYNNPDVIFLKTEGQKGALDMFTSDRALIYASTLTDAETMRTMDSDFGIIPYPKLTETQEYYKTTSRDNRSMFCIPTDVADTDFAGLITEALCVDSNSKVIPAYYDIVLKGKITRDNDSEAMLDIIRSGVTFDFVSEYAIQTERAGFILRDSVYYKKNIVTYYTQNEKKFSDAFEKFVSLYYDDTSAS
jgi:hypothetical protein